MKRKRKPQKSIILRVFILAFCAYMTVTLMGLLKTLNEKRDELDALKNLEAQVINNVEELKSILDSDSNDKLIEKAARERLGYIYSDEQVFIDISGN